MLHKAHRASSKATRLFLTKVKRQHQSIKPKSKLKFVTLDEEITCARCGDEKSLSKEELAEKAQDIEVKLPVKKSLETWYKLDPAAFFVNHFWGSRPDGDAIN